MKMSRSTQRFRPGLIAGVEGELCPSGERSGPEGIRESTDTCEMESAAQAHGLYSEEPSCDYPIRADKGRTERDEVDPDSSSERLRSDSNSK